jgi:type I restriction enzyme, R subunit
MSIDMSEKGLETLIVRALTGVDGLGVSEQIDVSVTPSPDGLGYFAGAPKNFDRGFSVDVAQLFAFLYLTQPGRFAKLGLLDQANPDSATRKKFLARLSDEVGKRGVIDVLRKGIDHGAVHIDLFYGTPSEGNVKATELYGLNRFSITRQLAYSLDQTRRALDLGLFINGLPIATFELKNSLTKQTVDDAVKQYQITRLPSERLFEFGRCVVHFAVDESEVRMCTKLEEGASRFLPFNLGNNDGAGNPPNPNGLKTAYLWEEVLAPASLTNILENYAQIVETKDPKSKKVKRDQVFPRFHQLSVVRKALDDVRVNGAGKRYLIQHSAGSGKSNSIAWLAHQLIGVKRDGKEVFDSVIVVTDRVLLDDQLQTTLRQFMQVKATVGHANHSGDLRKFILEGRKIIVTTVQKFPFITAEIAGEATKNFAIIIDEAHSSQGGKASGAMSKALGEVSDLELSEDEADPEDTVNAELERLIASKKMMRNASYFAFTATPKNKTLEMFGEAMPPDAEGKIGHRPFHAYTMRQAIEECFILDVLKGYTPVDSYYKLVKRTDDDPEFDANKANKKLRKYVESNDHAILLKAEIMVDHFHDHVINLGKIEGKARAMIVTSGIERAIQYFFAVRQYLVERKSPYKAIVAFSDEFEYNGERHTEASLNGFGSNDIADTLQTDPYRLLIVADKFQTGYDEPLLHTMYVDKPLSGIKAVQTLSRLNRSRAGKHDCFVLDFQNNAALITEAFQNYYQTTVLSEETDPNKLHDLKNDLDAAQVYTPEQIEDFVRLFLVDAKDRGPLDPILDVCVATYTETLDESQQVAFKGNAKAFCRTYSFLSSILPYANKSWEKLSILLNFLVLRLPAPQEADLAQGILDAIDMDSYRVEKKAALSIGLQATDALIEPVPSGGGGAKPDPKMEKLSNILKQFNENFGTLFEEGDRIIRKMRDDIAQRAAADPTYRNAKANTPHTARLAHDQAVGKAMLTEVKDDTALYKQFVENESFKRFILDYVYLLNNDAA